MTEKSFHEAGHAVAASVLGQPIKQATMDGVTTLVKVGCDQARRNEAIIAMAGPAAETRAMSYSEEQSDGALENGLGGRQGKREEAARGAGTEHAMRQARWIMEDNWDAVTKVAEALEKHGTLSGEDVAGLLS